MLADADWRDRKKFVSHGSTTQDAGHIGADVAGDQQHFDLSLVAQSSALVASAHSMRRARGLR